MRTIANVSLRRFIIMDPAATKRRAKSGADPYRATS